MQVGGGARAFVCFMRMGFWYHVPIPLMDNPQPAMVRLVQWLVEEGEEVHPGTRMALVEGGPSRFWVTAAGDGILREQLFPAGAEIESWNPIAVVAADGEKIPYGRPHSNAERVG